MKFPFNLDRRGFQLFTFFLHFTFECHIIRTWQNIWRFWHVLSTSNQFKELNRQATQQLLISWQCLSNWRCCYANLNIPNAMIGHHHQKNAHVMKAYECAELEMRICLRLVWVHFEYEGWQASSSKMYAHAISSESFHRQQIKPKHEDEASYEGRECDIFLSFSPSYTHVKLLMWRRTRWCDG